MTSHMQDLGLNFSTPKVTKLEPGVMTHAFKPKTQRAEAGTSLRVQGQPGLHSTASSRATQTLI